MLCSDHPEESLVYYCNGCDLLICTDCVSEGQPHHQHGFGKITKMAEIKRIELQGMLAKEDKEIVKDLKAGQEKIKRLQQMEMKTVGIMRGRAKEIKTKVDNVKDREVTKYRKVMKRTIEPMQNSLEKMLDGLENISKVMNQTDIEILHFYSDLLKSRKWATDSDFMSNENLPVFVNEGEMGEKLEKIYGSIETDTELSSECQSSDERHNIVTMTYIKGETPQYIYFTEADMGWIKTKEGRLQYSSSLRKNVIDKSRTTEPVKCAVVTTNGDILYVPCDIDNKIRKIKKDGSNVPWVDLTPYVVECICVTTNDDVIVCIKRKAYHNAYSYKTIRMDKLGQQNGIIFNEDTSMQVERIVANEDGRLCYVQKGRGLWIDEKGLISMFGTLKFKPSEYFSGTIGTNPHDFCITDFCWDKEGRVIVLESKHNAVYLVRKSTTNLVKEIIVHPEDGLGELSFVAVDPRNRLWIGTKDSNVYIKELPEPQSFFSGKCFKLCVMCVFIIAAVTVIRRST